MVKLLRGACAAAVLGVGLLASPAVSSAASLNLISTPPDVLSNFVQASYNATTHTLTATGMATQLTDASNNISSISNGAFTLSATFSITGSGSTETLTPTSASLNVTGNSGAHTYFASSNLLNFGFSTNNDGSAGITNQSFQFIFSPGATGDYAGRKIGVILATQVNAPYAQTYFDGFFNNTAGNLFMSATADTFAFPVPLPSAAWMGLTSLAAAGLIVRRRRRLA